MIDQSHEEIRKNRHGFLPFFLFGGKNVFAVTLLPYCNIIDGEPFGTQEPFQGLGGVAISVKSRFFRGAFDLFFQIFLTLSETVDE